MQQSLRAAAFVEHLRTLRNFPPQVIEPVQQALVQLNILRRRFTDLERVHGIAHVGLVKVNAQVAAVQSDFSKQRMTGELCVQAGDHFDCCTDALAIDLLLI